MAIIWQVIELICSSESSHISRETKKHTYSSKLKWVFLFCLHSITACTCKAALVSNVYFVLTAAYRFDFVTADIYVIFSFHKCLITTINNLVSNYVDKSIIEGRSKFHPISDMPALKCPLNHWIKYIVLTSQSSNL